MAVGNCIDKYARFIGLSNDPSPGYNVEILARKFVGDESSLVMCFSLEVKIIIRCRML
jgi:tRNA A37 threonylcarbamoyltransferase TsaD